MQVFWGSGELRVHECLVGSWLPTGRIRTQDSTESKVKVVYK